MGRVDLPAVGQHLEHDGRARQRDEASEEQRHAPTAEKRESRGQRGEDGEPHLREAAHENLAAHFLEAAERKLDADREQQQNDADLGESLDVLRIGDESQRVGPSRIPATMNPGSAGSLSR